MPSDTDVVVGEQGGYVPCFEMPASLTLSDNDGNAVTGDGGGYVGLDQSAAAAPSVAEDGVAVAGVADGFVAAPCDLTCSAPLSYFDRDRPTTWRIIGDDRFVGLRRSAHVTDGTPPSGPATEFETDGPFWENPPAFGGGAFPKLSAIVNPRWLAPPLPGDPWLLDEYTLSHHLSWVNVSVGNLSYPQTYLRITGTPVIDIAWSGTGDDDARAIAPPLKWELLIENYGTLDVLTSPFYDPASPTATLDDLYFTGHGYGPTVIATGVNSIGTYPLALDVLIPNPGTPYIQLFLRIANDQPETVALFPLALPTWYVAVVPRYPDYPAVNDVEDGITGMEVHIDGLGIYFCD